jgi:hypothetical protein
MGCNAAVVLLLCMPLPRMTAPHGATCGLQDLGVPRDKEPGSVKRDAAPAVAAGSGGVGGAGGMASSSTYLRGMLGYVRQTLGMYDEGQTLARVAGLQGLVQQVRCVRCVLCVSESICEHGERVVGCAHDVRVWRQARR